MKKKLIIGVIIVVIIGVFLYIRGRSAPVVSEETQVYRGKLQEKLSLSGKIDAAQKATLRFLTAGKLTSVQVKEGDIVKKNQVIASLDQRQLEKELQQQLNTYMTTRWSFDQTKSDNQTTADTGSSTIIRERAQRLIDQSQFSLNNSVLAVEAKSLSLEFSTLHTPISGIITRVVSPLPGVQISTPSQAEFDVVDPTSIYFEALADQTEITKLTAGQTAEITFDSYPDTTVSGSIAFISFTPKTDEVGTVYQIHMTIPVDNTNYMYRLGMTGDLTFITGEKENVLIIPTKFIKTEKDKQYVTTLENGKKVKREIETGMETDTETEVRSGLMEGDVVYD